MRCRNLEAECLTEAASYRRARRRRSRLRGEQLVAGLLDGAGWTLLHDCYSLMDSRADPDHLVVRPQGATLIGAGHRSHALLSKDEGGMALGCWRRDDDPGHVRACSKGTPDAETTSPETLRCTDSPASSS